MIEEIYFQDDGKPRVTAASVGISRRRWGCVNENKGKSEALAKMKKERFDLLPIINSNGEVKSYFKTKSENDYTDIEEHKIGYNDTIDLRTDIEQVINLFKRENKSFYFLTSKGTVVGLITRGNLNCKQVQVHIFHLICELERCIGDFINFILSNDEIIEWAKGKVNPNSRNDKYSKMVAAYDELVSEDLENMFTEHFFFVDFFKLISEKKLYKNFGFSSSDWKKYKSINEIRNRIAHPSRSLIDRENTLEKLDERLEKIKELIFVIKYNSTINEKSQR